VVVLRGWAYALNVFIPTVGVLVRSTW